jgi:hypothetical protein
MRPDGKWNTHLAVVVEQILPAIEAAGLKYWTCGGIGVAGALGRFIRTNEDVDIYVLETEFRASRSVLAGFCLARPDWSLHDSPPLRGRPQTSIYENGLKRLSMVPVYDTAGGIEFRTKISEWLPRSALHQETKQLDGFRFISPPSEIVQALLASMLIERPRLLSDPESRRRKDALELFTPQDLGDIEREIARRQRRRSRL